MSISRRQLLSTLSMTALAVGRSSTSESGARLTLGAHDHTDLEQPPTPSVGNIRLRASGMSAAIQLRNSAGTSQALDFGLVEVSARKHYPTLSVPRNMVAIADLGLMPDAVSDDNLIWNLSGKNVEVISGAATPKPIVVNDTPLTPALLKAGEPSTKAQWATLAWAMDLAEIGGSPLVSGWRTAASTASVLRVSSGASVEPAFAGAPANEDLNPGRYLLAPGPPNSDRVYKDSVRVLWTTTHVTLRFTSRTAPGVALGSVVARYRPAHLAMIRLSNFPADWLHRQAGVKQTDIQAHAALIGIPPANLRLPEFVRYAGGSRAGGCDCCLMPIVRETVTGSSLPSL